jgi:rod shape-determining protein MreC
LLLLLSVAFLVLHETGLLAPVERGLQFIVAPLQRGFSSLFMRLSGLFTTVRDVRELQTQVDELQAQVDALTIENIRLREFEAEAAQLRAMLSFAAQDPIWAVLGADVIGREACAQAPCGELIAPEPNPHIRYITINAGDDSGVAVGMPVVSGGAVLIGRVAEVGLRMSKIQLLSDNGSSVAATLQDTRATGLVTGQADGGLRMIYVPQGEEILVGDLVLTSGLGGTLPSGLVIGQVAEVQQSDSALFQEAVVRPALDYGRVELLLVITSFEPLVPVEVDPGEQP